MVEPKQLAQWARETEIEAGKGAARRGGKLRTSTLATLESQSGAARGLATSCSDAGYAGARSRSARTASKLIYTVRIRQLPSRAEAEALAGQLQRQVRRQRSEGGRLMRPASACAARSRIAPA